MPILPFATTDPFTQVHDALWGYAEAEPYVADNVRVGNRVKRNGSARGGPKDQVATADLPELDLIPANTAHLLVATSDHSDVTMRFNWILKTGDQRPEAALYPIQWGLVRAMMAAKNEDLGLGKGDGTSSDVEGFVRDLKFESDATQFEPDSRVMQAISVLSVVVEMQFLTTSDLLS